VAPALASISVAEYAPNGERIVVGAGHAEKDQVKHMVRCCCRAGRPTDSVTRYCHCHAHHRGAQTLAKILARS
jgi:Holliday junction resolvasome RuvABC endonuclease subunit